MTQNREVNFQKNSREFSRIETLAGHWMVMMMMMMVMMMVMMLMMMIVMSTIVMASYWWLAGRLDLARREELSAETLQHINNI